MMNQTDSKAKKLKRTPGAIFRSNKGMTLAEVLIVVAITIILMGLVFISVLAYQRSMAQLERDGYAKELFIAAQNHLTMARGEGYTGVYSDDSKLGTEVIAKDKNGKDVSARCIVINTDNNAILEDESSMAHIMLPFGSIDDTIRKGGSYMIFYQPETGTVLDVFYASEKGNPERFNHKLIEDEIGSVYALRDSKDANGVVTSKASQRREVNDIGNPKGWVLGWYGGDDVEALSKPLDAPTVNLVNDDILYAEVYDSNYNRVQDSKKAANCMLIIEGKTSGARFGVSLDPNDSNSSTRYSTEAPTGTETTGKYVFILDDITKSDHHFYDLTGDVEDKDANNVVHRFIPGEDIEVRAVSYSKNFLSNIAFSDTEVENSLYESLAKETVKDDADAPDRERYKATVSSFRHLENLEEDISHNGRTKAAVAGGQKDLVIEAVSQTKDLDRETFPRVFSGIKNWDRTRVYTLNSSNTQYYPVSYESALIYDGLRHKIENVTIDVENLNAGMFGTVAAGSKIKNLEMIDFDVKGSAYAGALAGLAYNTAVNNVVVYNTAEKDKQKKLGSSVSASGTGNAGGLIGAMSGGSIMYSAAALSVSGQNAVGGLVGKTDAEGSANVRIHACYAAGHTVDGQYKDNDDEALYNVKASSTGNAGGLIGDASKTTVTKSYSTCSASGGPEVTGGLIGKTSNGENADVTVTDCYATGLVSGKYAFIGSGKVSISDTKIGSWYYQIINHNEGDNTAYKNPGSTTAVNNAVDAFDENAKSFDTFSGSYSSWNDAKPYDSYLAKHYNNKYCFKTVTQLTGKGKSYYVNTHYGDWPAPEAFIINAN